MGFDSPRCHMETTNGSGTIVVGVDGSAESAHALAWAQAEAGIGHRSVLAVHAWTPPVPMSEISVMAGPTDPEPYRAAAEEVLTRVVAEAAPSPAVRSRLVRGHASFVLLELLKEADLLVVGSRGRGGFTGLLLGSVSQHCVTHAVRPVAVIPTAAPLPPGGDVVVGVDDSPGAEGALVWAAAEAGARGARLRVVHAWWEPALVSPAGLPVPALPAHDVQSRAEDLVRRMVEGAVARVHPARPAVDVLVLEAPPARALLDQATDAGLLVVGSRGRGGFAGLLLGSVSQRCVHHAPCAVVVVPPAR